MEKSVFKFGETLNLIEQNGVDDSINWLRQNEVSSEPDWQDERFLLGKPCPKCKSLGQRDLFSYQQQDHAGVGRKDRHRVNCAKCGFELCSALPFKFDPLAFGEETIPFGKHKGTPYKSVPADYLLWLSNNSNDFRLRKKLSKFLKREI